MPNRFQLMFYSDSLLLMRFNFVTPQIIFDGFTVGRFDEGIADNDFETTDASLMLSSSGAELPGCPDGFMQVWDWLTARSRGDSRVSWTLISTEKKAHT